MARIISVASGKGGVGKTTLVSNLAAALAKYNQSVVAFDTNLTTSNLGLHLGIHLYPKTLHDVLDGTANLREVVYEHKSGFRVVPGDISLRKPKNVKSHHYIDLIYKLLEGTDFVLIDSPAGLGKETIASIKASDEMLTVTNAELPAVTDAFKLSVLANKTETRNIGVVVNRIKKESHEIPLEHIHNLLNVPIIGRVPEDKEVRKAIALKEPVIISNPGSPAAQHFRSIAAGLIGEEYKPRMPLGYRMFGWIK